MKSLKTILIFSLIIFGLSHAVHADLLYPPAFILSTQNDATLGGLAFAEDDLVTYDDKTGIANLHFSGNLFSGSENIDAAHILPNTHILLSTTTGATLGGLTFRDGDIVDYNPISNTSTLFFNEDHFTLSENIDAFSLLGNGNYAMSTENSATLGGLTFGEGDIVEYNPFTDTASLLLSENIFGRSENIDALHILPNSNIILSTATAATINGLSFDEDDLVKYNLSTGTAALYFDGKSGFSLQENIDAVYVTPVPTPAAIWLFGSGMALIGMIRRKMLPS